MYNLSFSKRLIAIKTSCLSIYHSPNVKGKVVKKFKYFLMVLVLLSKQQLCLIVTNLNPYNY